MFDETHSYGKVTSLFSGCGGLDYGFSQMGFRVSAAFDADEHAVSCYNANHSNEAVKFKIHEGWQLENPTDVIIAGPPCQGFSTGGGYKENDPRNSLLLSTCRVIAQSGAKLAVIENVAALTNKRNRQYLQRAIKILTEAGYACTVQVYSAVDFGVAQRRKRTLIFARKGNALFQAPVPSRKRQATVAEALSNMPITLQAHKPKYPEASSKHAIISRYINAGQKLCNVRASSASVATWDIPEWFGETTAYEKEILSAIRSLRRRNRKRNFGDADPVSISEIKSAIPQIKKSELSHLINLNYVRRVGGNFDLRDTFNGKYRRLDPNDVSPTVDTRFGDIQLFLHPWEDRALTVREAARLQGFPDSFIFPDREKDAFRLIGNAVPPPMAEQIAAACRELLQ